MALLRLLFPFHSHTPAAVTVKLVTSTSKFGKFDSLSHFNLMDLVPLMAELEAGKLNAPNDKSKEEMENAPFKPLTQRFPEAVVTPDSLSQSLHTLLPISLLLTEPKGHILHVSEPSKLANDF